MNFEIISCGEYGSEQGCLAAAFAKETKAYGYIRKGWLTNLGPCEKVKWLGVQELETDRIRDCAQRCIDECDGILILKSGELSKIEENIISLNAEARPVYVYDYQKPDDPRCITTWMLTNSVTKLYVTGRNDQAGLDIFFKKSYALITHVISDITGELLRKDLENLKKGAVIKPTPKPKAPDEGMSHV